MGTDDLKITVLTPSAHRLASRNFFLLFLGAHDRRTREIFGPLERRPDRNFAKTMLRSPPRTLERVRVIASSCACEPGWRPTMYNGTRVPKGYRLASRDLAEKWYSGSAVARVPATALPGRSRRLHRVRKVNMAATHSVTADGRGLAEMNVLSPTPPLAGRRFAAFARALSGAGGVFAPTATWRPLKAHPRSANATARATVAFLCRASRDSLEPFRRRACRRPSFSV